MRAMRSWFVWLLVACTTASSSRSQFVRETRPTYTVTIENGRAYVIEIEAQSWGHT